MQIRAMRNRASRGMTVCGSLSFELYLQKFHVDHIPFLFLTLIHMWIIF